MKKINLKEFDVFTDITKRQRVRCDMRRSVANLLYNQMHGIEALNLALMIHRSDGELSVSDEEVRYSGADRRVRCAHRRIQQP